MADNKFSKKERIVGLKRIDKLFQEDEGEFIYPFRYSLLENNSVPNNSHKSDKNCVSVLITVSKRHHKNATTRNLLKRRIREAYRTNKHLLVEQTIEKQKCIDIAFIYCVKEVADFNTINDGVKKILKKISQSL